MLATNNKTRNSPAIIWNKEDMIYMLEVKSLKDK